MSTAENGGTHEDAAAARRDVTEFRSPLAKNSVSWSEIDFERRRSLSEGHSDAAVSVKQVLHRCANTRGCTEKLFQLQLLQMS